MKTENPIITEMLKWQGSPFRIRIAQDAGGFGLLPARCRKPWATAVARRKGVSPVCSFCVPDQNVPVLRSDAGLRLPALRCASCGHAVLPKSCVARFCARHILRDAARETAAPAGVRRMALKYLNRNKCIGEKRTYTDAGFPVIPCFLSRPDESCFEKPLRHSVWSDLRAVGPENFPVIFPDTREFAFCALRASLDLARGA